MSAGFDAAAGDPLGEGAVTPAGFGRMTRALAHEVQGRLLLALEGGYSLSQLPRCAAACVRALLDETPCALEEVADVAGADCCEVRRAAPHAHAHAHSHAPRAVRARHARRTRTPHAHAPTRRTPATRCTPA